MASGLCEDIDECVEMSHECEQNCQNAPGTYTCSCDDNFVLKEDKKSCKQSKLSQDILKLYEWYSHNYYKFLTYRDWVY